MMNQVTGRHIHDMIARQGGERIFEIEKDTIFKDKTQKLIETLKKYKKILETEETFGKAIFKVSTQ